MRCRPLPGPVVLSLLAAICLPAAPLAAAKARNPFLQKSTLPFEAPPFDKIRPADFAPAFAEGMRQDLAEVRKIASNPDPPTFANTLEALERSGQMLTRVEKAFVHLVASDTSPALQKIRAEESPRLAAHLDAILLDPKLYARVKALYLQRETLSLSPEAGYLLEVVHR